MWVVAVEAMGNRRKLRIAIRTSAFLRPLAPGQKAAFASAFSTLSSSRRSFSSPWRSGFETTKSTPSKIIADREDPFSRTFWNAATAESKLNPTLGALGERLGTDASPRSSAPSLGAITFSGRRHRTWFGRDSSPRWRRNDLSLMAWLARPPRQTQGHRPDN